jgi:UDP-4-amino-4-deoxy-L-arabinose formyltransferase/UDP-glucuronic acid dehydrogenase (UDP-4-keto-hexauronic acid decarboxylating)
MNIAIIGRTEILFNTALLLREAGHNIKLIITAKEAPEYTRSSDDFAKLAKDIGSEFIMTSKISDSAIISLIRKVGKINIGISLNYVNIISQEVIDLFPLGILNAHGGDLPKYRGNACQAWAILNKEKYIGLCIHKMIGGELDSGDIIERIYFPIDINTRVGECYSWMSKEIPSMFLEAIQKLEHNKDYFLEKQSKNQQDALRCYPRRAEDGRIDWNQSAENILRLINASSEPYSGAFCTYRNERMIIWRAELYDDKENYLSEVGQISQINKDNSFIVITGKGKLLIKQYTGEKVKGIRERLK